jgi:hypothetical protein
MDTTQALKDAENSLRDFIAAVLHSKLGPEWVKGCGVTEARIANWKQRQIEDARKQPSGTPEERLLYYADFYDLPTILEKHRQHFSPAFGDKKKFLHLFDQINNLRNIDSYRRELLLHQKQLVLGISGEIRTLIVRYRSKMETPQDCFPRIENVRDNYQNSWVQGLASGLMLVKGLNTVLILHPGDLLEFSIAATDPEGMPLQYGLIDGGHDPEWQDSNQFSYTLTEGHISEGYGVIPCIKSPRGYHALSDMDDSVWFHYSVLPKMGRNGSRIPSVPAIKEGISMTESEVEGMTPEGPLPACQRAVKPRPSGVDRGGTGSRPSSS